MDFFKRLASTRCTFLLLSIIFIFPACSVLRKVDSPSTPLSKPARAQRVVADLEITPSEAQAGDMVEAIVRVKIATGHFIYATNAPEIPFSPLTVDLVLPAGVEPAGEWTGPEPRSSIKGTRVYTDSLQFRRPLRLPANTSAKHLAITGELRFQACTLEMCWPPARIKLSSAVRVVSEK